MSDEHTSAAGDPYVRPLITRLGTLSELTQGGFGGPDEGWGGDSDPGSI